MRYTMIACLGLMLAACPSWRSIPLPPDHSIQTAGANAPAFYFATLDATYFGDRGRLKGELGLIVAAPDRLLIEVRGPGGQPVSTFACDGSQITLFELEGPRFYRGPANPLTMARLLPLPVEPEIAVALLRGQLPMPTEAKSYRTKGKGQQIEGEHPTLGRLLVTRYSPDHWLWELPDEPLRVELKNPTKNGVFQDILIKAAKDEVHLRLSDLQSEGEAPSEETFQLKPPPGVATQRL
jgi:hypothetical protein